MIAKQWEEQEFTHTDDTDRTDFWIFRYFRMFSGLKREINVFQQISW